MEKYLVALANAGAAGAGIELALNQFSDYSWINDLLGVGAGSSNEELLILILLGAAVVSLIAAIQWVDSMMEG